MKKFLPIIRNSQLFAGIADEDTTEILACLDAKTTDYQKDCYILRIGDTITKCKRRFWHCLQGIDIPSQNHI